MPLTILRKYWHHPHFRPMQEEIIQSVLDRHDILALLPTGGGKSICFQVPALLMDGLCLVISPLIALMSDQVDHLVQKNIPAIAIHSGLTQFEVKTILQYAAEGKYKFIYLSPERLETHLFKEYLPALTVCLLVVDEAHCLSQWGYDFRPPYLRIANLRQELPGIPVIALTASATPMVQKDITEKLKFVNGQIFRQSFDRPNVSYSSFCVDSKINKVLDILTKVKGSSIVYCSSRKQTKVLANVLLLQSIPADYYHAGLSQQDRDAKQQAWIANQTRVMVCTNAFGMGIDKPDVRTVIHYDTPDCIESYYQEAGRCGRDGKKSFAVLIYQPENIIGLHSLPDKRFPPISEIKRIYQSLADYLQIPVGNGEGQYYDFDLLTFVKNFKLDSLLVINTIKVLEQEGHISFSESIFLPSQVNFTIAKENLHQFEISHPLLEPILKSLLRTYEGIYDNRVSIYEKQLSRLIRLPLEQVIDQLKLLQSFGLLEYWPQKDTPQIHFILNRASANYLKINQDAYLNRKKQYTQRVGQLIRYIQLSTECRSNFISNYFGETSTTMCGVCDNCLTKKRKVLSPAEFTLIETKIKQSIGKGISIEQFLSNHTTISQEKIWTVLSFLQAEQILSVDEQGILQAIS